MEEIRQADAVFVGNIVSYEIVSRDDGRLWDERGLLTINVINTIKGSVPSTVRLDWPNSTFGFAPEMSFYSPAIYAATYAPSGELELFQPPCSGGFILPHGAANEAVVTRVLAGGSSTFDSLDGWGGMDWVRLNAIRRSESPVGAFYGVILVAFTFLMSGLVVAWRTRKRRGA